MAETNESMTVEEKRAEVQGKFTELVAERAKLGKEIEAVVETLTDLRMKFRSIGGEMDHLAGQFTILRSLNMPVPEGENVTSTAAAEH